MGRGNFEERNGCPIVKYMDTLQSSMQKRLKLLRCRFGLQARMGRRNRVRWGPAVVKDVAMATNFGTQFAITGFMGYNFGCMIASDTLFDSRDGFSRVKLSDEDITDIECLRIVAMATNFGTKIAINWLCVNDSD